MKRLIYLLPLLLIGCKEAPKEYYSAGEVEVIEPVKHTTIVSDSDTIPIDNTSKNTSSNSNEVSPEAIEYMNKIKAETPLNHMINAEETAPHTVNIRVIE